MTRINIVFPVLNNFEQAWSAIRSIKTKHDIQITISPQWLKQKSLSQAWNEAITASKMFDYVLLANDDVLFSPHTVDALVSGFEDNDKKTLMVTGCNVRDEFPSASDILIAGPREAIYSPHPDFSMALVKTNILELVGSFDENFKPCYHEDVDFHYRMKLLGLNAVSSTAAFYYHYGSESKHKLSDQNKFNKQFDAGRQYYIKKWNGPPMEEKFINPYGDSSLTPKQWRKS